MQLQVNIYYEKNNKDHIYSAVYTDQNQMIRDMQYQLTRLRQINQGQNLQFYFDNAYAKTFAIQEQFVAFPSDQQILIQFLEIVFYLAVEKKHPVIAIFLTPQMNQSVFQGEEYWKQFNSSNTQNQNQNQQYKTRGENIQEKLKSQKEQSQKKTVQKIQSILNLDYVTTFVIYAIKKIPIPRNEQQNQSKVKVAILTNFEIKVIEIYSLKSDLENNQYFVSLQSTQIKRLEINKKFDRLNRYENIIEIQNLQKKDEKYLLVFNQGIPAFQFPLDLRNS